MQKFLVKITNEISSFNLIAAVGKLVSHSGYIALVFISKYIFLTINEPEYRANGDKIRFNIRCHCFAVVYINMHSHICRHGRQGECQPHIQIVPLEICINRCQYSKHRVWYFTGLVMSGNNFDYMDILDLDYLNWIMVLPYSKWKASVLPRYIISVFIFRGARRS